MNIRQAVRLSGILAIAGGLINAVSDLLLYSGPIDGKDVTLEYLGTLPHPYSLTLTGAVLGAAVGIPLWFFILVPLYYSLKDAGACFRTPVIVLFGYLVILSSAYHGAFALYAAGYRALRLAGGESAGLLADMIEKFLMFKNALGMFWFLTALLFSAWFIAAVLLRKTRFAKWAALWTPVMSVPVSIISSLIPAPMGGYIRPMASTLAITLFFVLVTRTVWHYEEKNKGGTECISFT